MADAMIRLQNQQGESAGSFKITREDLASMTGMASETVSRTLSDFKNEGLIEKKGSIITITNMVNISKMKN